MRQREHIAAGDIEHCKRLLGAGSKSFAMASRLLPQPIRDRTAVLYAFCRVSDDRIDADPSASQRTIDAMRERLRRAYDGRPYDDPVDRAFAGLLADTPIPAVLPEALIEGMEWDLRGRRYTTIEDLQGYAAHVAGTVGAMMTIIMMHGSSDRIATDVLARACDLGVAMQLSNIARDVGEDARRGRIYLPLAWMDEARIDVGQWLRRPSPSDALGAVVARLVEEADGLYRRADQGVTLLPRGCRVAIRAARLVYSDLGRSIARARFDSVSGRAVVSTWRKVWLVALAFATPWPTPSLVEAPPLRATRALVDACCIRPAPLA